MSDLTYNKRRSDRETTTKRVYTAWTNGIGAMVIRTSIVVFIPISIWFANAAWDELREWMREMSGDMKEVRTEIGGIKMKIVDLEAHDRMQEAVDRAIENTKKDGK
jgi:hypothetical protein